MLQHDPGRERHHLAHAVAPDRWHSGRLSFFISLGVSVSVSLCIFLSLGFARCSVAVGIAVHQPRASLPIAGGDRPVRQHGRVAGR